MTLLRDILTGLAKFFYFHLYKACFLVHSENDSHDLVHSALAIGLENEKSKSVLQLPKSYKFDTRVDYGVVYHIGHE